MTKEDILEAIRRTAETNGGVPLGKGRFERETGIKEYDCLKFWRSFGEAQREAGYAPNTLQAPHSIEFLAESMVYLMRELGRFPVNADLIGRRNRDSKFPSPGSFRRFGNKKKMAQKISEYAEQKGYNDIIKMCAPIIESSTKIKEDELSLGQAVGEVYLFKSGRYYKIGKTNNSVRRGKELRTELPEKLDLIHSIKTDDPSGIEAYWHKRFEAKRMQGEWFDLNSSDVKAFKCWRRIA